MALRNYFLKTAGVAVVDSFALYRIAVEHTPDAAALGEAARTGTIRLLTPATSFAVACGMRTCWDEFCDKPHKYGTGLPIRSFLQLGGLEIVDLTPTETVSAGQLYAGCLDRRITGAEVLAACHSALLAHSREAPLISAERATYCYSALEPTGISSAIEVV